MKLALLVLAGCSAASGATAGPWEPLERVGGSLGPSLPVPAAAPATLRIASWNVELAPHPDRTAAEIATSLELARADVILVQEIDSDIDEGATRASQLTRALGPGWTWFYAIETRSIDHTHGNAILSRFPLGAPEVKVLPRIEQSVNTASRIAQRAVLDLGGGRALTIVNVHLDTRISAVDRIRQLDPAVSDNPDEVVIGGDLNTLPWAWVDNAVPLLGTEAIVGQDQAQIVDDYFEDLGFETPIPHGADTHEFPADMRLDAICPRGLPSTSHGVARDAGGSDHYAVWIDVAGIAR